MIILTHSTYGERTIASSLGMPEYSYWFVRKAFQPVLERLGVVTPVTSPETEVDRIYRSALSHGQRCVFLSFSPPHQTPLGLACPTVPVFAWEFDTIPNETWDGEAENDWRYSLSRLPAAITHSQFSVEAVRRSLGSDYPIWSIPAPIAARYKDLAQTSRTTTASVQLELADAAVFDTGAIDLTLFAPGEADRSHRALRALQAAAARKERTPRRLELGGVVYTTVLNPLDGRKNWTSMVAAFVYAFRQRRDATLVIKTTYRDLDEAVRPMLQHIAKLGSFACRVVIIHGMLSDGEYAGLIQASTFAVNASHGEGQCLPLMEFMAAGRPAVAPRHTAMLEYVSDADSFIVADHQRPAFWPHDTRQGTRCLRHEVEFGDLVLRLQESFAVASGDPARYASMSRAATQALDGFCSDEVTTARLRQIFQHLGCERPDTSPAVDSAAASTTPDGFLVGLKDAGLSGWYNKAAGELAPGFPVSADDVLIDVGCGDGGPASFSARAGAHVVLADVDTERVQQAALRLRDAGASRLEALVTDADPLPLPDGYASRVVCMEVMEHVDDPQVLMRELARVGRPGALYLLTVPGHVHEHAQKSLAAPAYFERPNHIRIIDPASFAELVQGVGLQIEHRFTYGFYWSLWWTFYWQTGKSLQDASDDPLLSSWARTWNLALDGRDGLKIHRELNKIMPKSQVIVARKPA